MRSRRLEAFARRRSHQTDFYDDPTLVDAAADRLAAHFAAHL
jgi:hypothetical protein